MMNRRTVHTILAVLTIWLTIVILISAIGRIKQMQPDGFVAKVTPAVVYEVTLAGEVEGDFYISEQGKLFCASLDAQRIFVLEALEGKVEKQLTLNERFSSVNQVEHETKLYYVLGNTAIYVIDSECGELLGSFRDPLRRYYQRIVQVDGQGRLITSNLNANLSVVDLDTGQVQAHVEVDALTGLVVNRDVVYYWRRGFNVHALDSRTLDMRWKYVDDYLRGDANITCTDDALFYNDFYHTKVFDAKTGVLLYDFPLQTSHILISGNLLYSAGVDTLACHDLSGRLIWSVPYGLSGPLIEGGFVYAQDPQEDILAKLTADEGVEVYRTEWSKGTIRSVIQTERFDLVQDTSGQVSLLDSATGEELWRSERPPGDKLVPWIVYRGKLIISDGRNKIVSFDLNGVKR